MDRIDELLTRYFAADAKSPRVDFRPVAPTATLTTLARRIGIEAGARGVRRLTLAGSDETTTAGRAHAQRARREVAEFLAGRRTFFSVPVDLDGVAAFQARVLAAASAIPFGEVRSYAELAASIRAPRAARAVGNALAANPVPLIVPCHRIVRGDGTWGNYALGPRLKTALLQLERHVPLLIGCVTTRIVCRRGCAHEQRIRDDRRIVFASVGDARSVGYRPCTVCRPAA